MDCCREARLARAPATRRQMACRMSEVRDRRLEAMELATRLCAWLKPSSFPCQIRPSLTNKELDASAQKIEAGERSRASRFVRVHGRGYFIIGREQITIGALTRAHRDHAENFKRNLRLAILMCCAPYLGRSDPDRRKNTGLEAAGHQPHQDYGAGPPSGASNGA